MEYQKLMKALSQCGLGAILLSVQDKILSVNEAGRRLLHGGDELEGTPLSEIAAPLCEDSKEPLYANIAFGEYLVRCPAPDVTGLPVDSRLIVFRNAPYDACHDMLISTLNQLREAVALFDAEGRVYLLNDAAVNMESITTQDVLGENVSVVYQMLDEEELAIPKVIREKRPILNHRQHYMTRYGKEISTISSTFPIVQNGQVLGGFNIMEDWSTIDSLHKQIIDLQDKLLELTSAGKQKTKSVLPAKYKFCDINYVSPAMSKVVTRCRQVAKSDSSVMIYGETGTGKELFAQSIHNASSRADGPFLAINCAAIPDNLLEGLLFGTERGAYTGAECRPGLLEQADSGTFLLDEINSMNINLQSKLLRFLQEGTFMRVGGFTEFHVDVRVLSNINIPPQQAIEENKLRRDLFYRLGVVNINLPPLRERKEDIVLLAKSFIIRYNKKLLKNVKDIDRDTKELFYTYNWPGNVRELQNAIECAMNILPDDVSMISPEYLPDHILTGGDNAASMSPGSSQAPRPAPPLNLQAANPLNNTIRDLERRTICRVLRESGGNISEAARILKMSRQNLQYRIRRYQIDISALLNSSYDELE